jgi:hypothetical protein
MSDTSSLARELGAIASGEAWRNTREWDDKEQTDRFATGLERLIDERIAAAVAPLAEKIAMLVTCEADGSAALAREDLSLRCMGNGCGVVPHRRQPSPEAGPAWRCSECGEPRSAPKAAEPALSRSGEHNPPSDDVKPAAVAIGDTFRRWGVVYEVTRNPKGEPCESFRLDSNTASVWVHGVDALTGPGSEWERVHPVDMPKAAEPVPGVVAVGDTFLRLTRNGDRWTGGELLTVCEVSEDRDACLLKGGGIRAVISEAMLLHSGDWQCVPAGYVLPAATECLAEMRRLIAARDKMKADPRTGTDGIDACIDEMARMAGMVPA